MSLQATGLGAPPADPFVVPNVAFWPALSPAQCRTAYRVDGTVTPERLVAAIEAARDETNKLLATAQTEWLADGVATAAAIPCAPWQVAGYHALTYQRAVYCAAMAILTEQYREVTATAQGNDAADRKAPLVESYRRDARFAVADLKQQPRSTVELI